MRRRQLLAGLGGLVGGGGLLLGTGAFTSVNADRDASVAVAEEDEAFLRIIESPNTANGAFASTTSASDGEQVYLDFNNSIPGQPSEGPGQSSEYEFDDVFRIENQGTQTVYVNITALSLHSGATTLRFYVRDGSGARQFIGPGHNDLEVGIGTTRQIGVTIDTSDESNYSTPIQDGGQTTITANASSDDNVISP